PVSAVRALGRRLSIRQTGPRIYQQAGLQTLLGQRGQGAVPVEPGLEHADLIRRPRIIEGEGRVRQGAQPRRHHVCGTQSRPLTSVVEYHRRGLAVSPWAVYSYATAFTPDDQGAPWP